MYLHAYQSFIWNEAVSKRIELFGLKPCVGDLVQIEKSWKHRTGNKSDGNNSSNDGVEFVTSENIKMFSINDVVLPLPGHSVLYPKNKS